MHGVQIGALMAVTLVLATLVKASLRLGGIRIEDTVTGAAFAVALAIAPGAAFRWLLMRRCDAWWAYAAATVAMTLATGGPLPVAQSVRGAWLALAFMPICLPGGIASAALPGLRSSRQEKK